MVIFDLRLHLIKVFLGVHITNGQVVIAQALSPSETRNILHHQLVQRDDVFHLVPLDKSMLEYCQLDIVDLITQSTPKSSRLLLSVFEAISASPHLHFKGLQRSRGIVDYRWTITLAGLTGKPQQEILVEAASAIFGRAVFISPPAAIISYLRQPFLPSPYRILIVDSDGIPTVLVPTKDVTSNQLIMHKTRFSAPFASQDHIEDPHTIDYVAFVDSSSALSTEKDSLKPARLEGINTPPVKHLALDSVARGAAIASGWYNGPSERMAPFRWYIHFPRTVSIKLADGLYHTLLHSWYYADTVTVTTIRDGQTSIQVDVCLDPQSRTSKAQPTRLGAIVLEGLPVAPAGTLSVHVLMRPRFTRPSVVEVQLIEQSSGVRVLKEIALDFGLHDGSPIHADSKVRSSRFDTVATSTNWP